MSPDELKDHVCALAGDIGERSVAAFRAHSDFPVGHVATFGFMHTPAGTPDRLNYPAMARLTSGLSGPSGTWLVESC